MARPRSDDRRNAILSAATHVIAGVGLSAPTAAIATEAGVSNGSLFGYFDTKAALLNELYFVLKSEMVAAASDGLPAQSDAREQVLHLWNQWLHWGASFPEKRRTLTLLDVSADVTAETHRVVHGAFTGIAALLDRSRAAGPMRDAPLDFVLALMTAVAEATIDSTTADPVHAAAHQALAFDALWRMLA